VLIPGDTAISFARKPIEEKTNVVAVEGNEMEKVPSFAVVVAWEVPLMETVAPTTANWSPEFVTLPVMVLFWAERKLKVKSDRKHVKMSFNLCISFDCFGVILILKDC